MSNVAIRFSVVVGGLVTLGIQVLIPRFLHPYFGSGTATAAAVVAMALAGLAAGYQFGGRPKPDPVRVMSTAFKAAAVHLVIVGVLVRLGVGQSAVPARFWLVPTAALLVGIPSFLLGMVSPLAIQALGDGRIDSTTEGGTGELTTGTSASVFGLSTAANVVGGLISAFLLAPFVGISFSLIGYGLILITAVLALQGVAEGKVPALAATEARQAPAPATGGTGARLPAADGGDPDDTRSLDQPVVLGYLALAFYSGVASIALEVNASRMLASYFGPTTGLWASVLAVSLGGLAIGYHLGGLIPLRGLDQALPMVVAANAAWLVGATWLISLLEPRAGLAFGAIAMITILAFGPPFVLFGMESQILVGAVWKERRMRSMSSAAASVFAVSSVGGILGALLGIAYLIPLLGVSGLVRLFMAGYLAVLALTWAPRRLLSLGLAVVVAIIPLPDWVWDNTTDRLVAQEEGRFQTIRVYTDDRTFLRFNLGPTYESEVDMRTGEPRFGYASRILELVGEVAGRRALVIGGAGHALGHALESRGAVVTEVELDPIVRDVSDRVFGPLTGDTIVDDGRRFVTAASSDTYDIVIVDAFAGPRYVPPHLTTVEFFDEVNRILTPSGTMYLNMISAVEGPGSGPFQALSSGVANAFDYSGYSISGGNIVVIGSRTELEGPVIPVEVVRSPNTDDKNPMDILLEFAR